MKTIKTLAAAFAATLVMAGSAMAQYPDRPIRADHSMGRWQRH
ncbi:hypothetical protein N8D56_26490 (plasmid) [Devosia sp. A8/3-2]|nr:hypothetical protein N8D56_26490 [Devosia sp. A8/3-2]